MILRGRRGPLQAAQRHLSEYWRSNNGSNASCSCGLCVPRLPANRFCLQRRELRHCEQQRSFRTPNLSRRSRLRPNAAARFVHLFTAEGSVLLFPLSNGCQPRSSPQYLACGVSHPCRDTHRLAFGLGEDLFANQWVSSNRECMAGRKEWNSHSPFVTHVLALCSRFQCGSAAGRVLSELFRKNVLDRDSHRREGLKVRCAFQISAK